MFDNLSGRHVVLARRPSRMPEPLDFRTESMAAAALGAGEMLVRNMILSIDPAIRGFIDDRPSYLPPVALGETIRSMTLGRVVRSRNAAFPEGTIVRALAGWADYSRIGGDAIGLETVAAAPDIALEHHIGALGPAGLTAWVGLIEIGRIAAGQTVVISAAAGAVGSIAGQIARLKGCRVVGLASSDAKIDTLRGIGFDAGVNYRAVPDVAAAIAAACPAGIDLYFDNVGGEILETMLPLMNEGGRVAVCGMVSDYNDAGNAYGVKTLWQLVVKRIMMRGFLTYDHADRLAQAQTELNGWVASGAIRPLYTLYQGIDAAPAALIDMLAGRTTGKTLVMLREETGT